MPVHPADFVFPCFVLRRDHLGEWRWTYYARNGEAIAVSSEGYTRREDCKHSAELIKRAAGAEVYIQRADPSVTA